MTVAFDLSIRDSELIQYLISVKDSRGIADIDSVKSVFGEDKRAGHWLFFHLERYYRNILRRFLSTHRRLILEAILIKNGCLKFEDAKAVNVKAYDTSYTCVVPLLIASLYNVELDANELKVILSFNDYNLLRDMFLKKFTKYIHPFADPMYTILSSPAFSCVVTNVRSPFRMVSDALSVLSLGGMVQNRIGTLKVLSLPYLIEIRGPKQILLDPLTQELIRFMFNVTRYRAERLQRVFEPVLVAQIRNKTLSDLQRSQLKGSFSQFLIGLIPSSSDWSQSEVVKMERTNLNGFISYLITCFERGSQNVELSLGYKSNLTQVDLIDKSESSVNIVTTELRASDGSSTSFVGIGDLEDNEMVTDLPMANRINDQRYGDVIKGGESSRSSNSSRTSSVKTSSQAALSISEKMNRLVASGKKIQPKKRA